MLELCQNEYINPKTDNINYYALIKGPKINASRIPHVLINHRL